MKVLIIGSGGREHAIAWKLSKSPKVTKLYCAPGNAGIGQIAECVPISAMEFDKLADFAQENGIIFSFFSQKIQKEVIKERKTTFQCCLFSAYFTDLKPMHPDQGTDHDNGHNDPCDHHRFQYIDPAK